MKQIWLLSKKPNEQVCIFENSQLLGVKNHLDLKNPQKSEPTRVWTQLRENRRRGGGPRALGGGPRATRAPAAAGAELRPRRTGHMASAPACRAPGGGENPRRAPRGRPTPDRELGSGRAWPVGSACRGPGRTPPPWVPSGSRSPRRGQTRFGGVGRDLWSWRRGPGGCAGPDAS